MAIHHKAALTPGVGTGYSKTLSPMNRLFTGRVCACVMLAAFVVAVSSCSTVSKGPGGQISKVKYFHLNPEIPLATEERALQMERDYHLYGAVTRAQQMERAGHYYTIFWKAEDRTEPLLVRFEYRQANSGLVSKTVEVPVDRIRRNNLTRFEVTGDAYRDEGRVTAWRVSLVRGGEILASQASYLWN